jgi:alkylation response protein AidB-like acyl-CoA dehydrogenase
MADLGWMALPFPAAYGGIDQGFISLTIVLAEMGRVVSPGPYLSTVLLAGNAILEAGSEAQRKELLPPIAAGELIATLALQDGPHWDDAAIETEATPSGSGFALRGTKRFVTDAASAERFVVAARSAEGPALFVTEAGNPGVEVRPATIVDGTRRVADLTFDGAAAEMLGEPGWDAVQRVLDRAAAGLAAEMLGGAERVLELATAYAKDRVQFGRPIGSFQAVKHKAADMLLDVESLRSAVYYAAWALERDHPDASLAASMAKAYASDAGPRVAAAGIQIHGGIGFTWEHDMHLYFKRMKASEIAFGDASWHRERIAQILKPRYTAR